MNLITKFVKLIGTVATIAALGYMATGCSEKPAGAYKPVGPATSPQVEASTQYAAEAPLPAEQCKRDPNEIFRDRKWKESMEGWRKIVAKDCPRSNVNLQTHQISAYFKGERFVVGMSEDSVRKGETQFVVHQVTRISPECRQEQRRLMSCIDSGKELIVCLERVSKPAPANCPMTMD